MHSVLEEEIRGRLTGLAVQVRQYDVGVVLAAALCFTPFPPVMLIGLVLSASHFALARSKLSKPESLLLYTGILVAVGYAAAWTIAIWWLIRTGMLHAALDFVTGWAASILQGVAPDLWHRAPPPPPLHQA